MQDSCEIETEIKKKKSKWAIPSVNIATPEQMYLVIDCEIVCKVDIDNGIFALLCGFLCYSSPRSRCYALQWL